MKMRKNKKKPVNWGGMHPYDVAEAWGLEHGTPEYDCLLSIANEDFESAAKEAVQALAEANM